MGLFTDDASVKAAQSASNKAAEVINQVGLPDTGAMQLDLEDLVSRGILTPEEAKSYDLGPSAMNGITTDPRYQEAQMDALKSLQGISDSGGMTDADKANLSKIATNEATQQRGSREAILQNAQARGVGGSGLELMAQLQNQQDSATRQNQRDLDVTGQAQARALQALQSAGQLGGQMQASQFGQQADIAKQQDAISQFNANNHNQFNIHNTDARNAAQASNLANTQNLANANTQQHNAEQQYNKGLGQQDFENQMQKAGARANAFNSQATQMNSQGAANTAANKSMAGSALQTTGLVLGSALSDKNRKENISHFDPSEFLDSLTSYKYNYKEPEKAGKGKFGGVMAQDLEKTPEGKSLVHDTPDGKVVDYGKGFGTLLAALTDVHKRVKHLEGKK